MFAFSLVSVCRFPFCFRGGDALLVGPGIFKILEELLDRLFYHLASFLTIWFVFLGCIRKESANRRNFP